MPIPILIDLSWASSAMITDFVVEKKEIIRKIEPKPNDVLFAE